MTQLTLERPGDHLFIRSVSEDGILIGDECLTKPLIISARKLIRDWSPESLESLDDAAFEPVLALEPEVILLGTGAQQKFLHPSKLAACYRAGVGIEVMTTAAACRTFNVLATEGRRVVGALFPLSDA